jgi:hypothetical protein
MKPYLILLALLLTLCATAQEDKPKRTIFGSDRMGLYVGMGTGYNTKINPNQYNWAKGLYLTQYTTLGYTFKNRFSIEYTHCFLYRTIKNVGEIKAGDSSYTVYYAQSPPETRYISKFVAYDANAQGLYSIDMLTAYIYLLRNKRWGTSFSFNIFSRVSSILYLNIEGKNKNGNPIRYKPNKPYTEAYPEAYIIIPNPCISFDYYINSNFNIKLNILPYGFGFSNTYSLGRQTYADKGDDSGFLQYWTYSAQFNIHVSYYFFNLIEKSKNL